MLLYLLRLLMISDGTEFLLTIKVSLDKLEAFMRRMALTANGYLFIFLI